MTTMIAIMIGDGDVDHVDDGNDHDDRDGYGGAMAMAITVAAVVEVVDAEAAGLRPAQARCWKRRGAGRARVLEEAWLEPRGAERGERPQIFVSAMPPV